MAMLSLENRWHARALAERIADWRDDEENANKRLHMVAGSAGGSIFGWACEATNEDGEPIIEPNTFERILLPSTTLSPGYEHFDRMAITSKCGVFAYNSPEDDILNQYDFSYSAGAIGFRFSHPSLYELTWTPDTGRSLGNYGQHLQCYVPGHNEEYLLPLFDSGCKTIPPGWKHPELGACCTGETCEVIDRDTCESDGGVCLGHGTTCEPNPCGASPP